MITVREVAFGTPDFDHCMALRMAVFVQEQAVPADEEIDDLDASARHFLAWDGDVAVGTMRLVVKDAGTTKVTRVAVRRQDRGRGVGVLLMQAAEAAARTKLLALDAQSHALGFYERLGYVAQGDEFMEANILHRRMVKVRALMRYARANASYRRMR